MILAQRQRKSSQTTLQQNYPVVPHSTSSSLSLSARLEHLLICFHLFPIFTLLLLPGNGGDREGPSSNGQLHKEKEKPPQKTPVI